MMCEADSRKLARDSALGSELPLELNKLAENVPELAPVEPFDLYEWALDFSKAAGFECERVVSDLSR